MDRVGQEMILRGLLIGLTLVTISAAQKQNKTGGLMVLVPDANLQLKEVSVDTLRFQASALAGAETEVVITVYTRRNPIEGQSITTGDVDSIRRSNYNPANPSRFLIHGYLHANVLQNERLRDKYIEIADYNVFFVKWTMGAATIDYHAAAANSVQAGIQVAHFMDFMHAKARMSFKNVYLIGHSLGAHVAGIAGKHLQRGHINTIFALDMAGPEFAMAAPSNRLTLGDANYIELIHTGAGGFGYYEPIGNASFFVNWGNKQPACDGVLGELCDHHMSIEYFLESLGPRTNEFYARQCQSFQNILDRNCIGTGRVARLGDDPSNYGKNVSGVFYLPTNAQPPYARGSAWLNSNSLRTLGVRHQT